MLRPVISFDNLTGNPELSFNLTQNRQHEKTIDQLFTFLDNQNISIVFAIDEFQQIMEYPEQNAEAILRSQIQTLKNINFIFCGSNQKIMHEIFSNPRRPFFASCSNLHLDFINQSEYADFIKKRFHQNRQKINDTGINYILDFTQLHTFYTQYFCNYLFAKNFNSFELPEIMNVADEILTINEPTYFQYRNLITESQWNLLTAIAKEDTVYQPHSQEFIRKYSLGTSSLISRSIQSLLKKELIYFTTATEKPYYKVYDKFLMRWLQK